MRNISPAGSRHRIYPLPLHAAEQHLWTFLTVGSHSAPPITAICVPSGSHTNTSWRIWFKWALDHDLPRWSTYILIPLPGHIGSGNLSWSDRSSTINVARKWGRYFKRGQVDRDSYLTQPGIISPRWTERTLLICPNEKDSGFKNWYWGAEFLCHDVQWTDWHRFKE